MTRNGLTLACLMLLLVAVAGCEPPQSAGTSGQKTQVQLLAPPQWTPEPLVTSQLFLFDCSADAAIVDTGATHTRLARSVEHARRVLATMEFTTTRQDYFDLMWFGGSATTQRLFGTVVPALAANLATADQCLQGLQPGGASPQYTALMNACLGTRSFLDRLYYYSASMPGADTNAPGGMATPTNILAAIPTWWSHFSDAVLWWIRVGNTPQPHEAYLQQLAAVCGGMYQAI